jgi:hypothetical protein
VRSRLKKDYTDHKAEDNSDKRTRSFNMMVGIIGYALARSAAMK